MLSVESPTTYYTMTRKYHDRYDTLEEDIEADVVIVGGGFSGINIALELAERGITNVVVLEANYLGFGGSGRNGGHVMAGIGHDLEKIRKYVGTDGVEAIFSISDQGASTIQRRIDRYGIDADFRRGYGYLAFNQRQAKLLQKWEKELRGLNPNEEIAYLEGAELRRILGSDAYSAGLMHMGNGHIHSLNLLLGEARAITSLGGRVYENSPVVEVTYGKTIKVRTAKGSVKAQKICFACGAFINRLEPQLDKTIISTYSFQLVTEPLSDELIEQISPIRGAFTDVRPAIDYYRVTNENRLLFGTVTHFLEYIPKDFKKYNRDAMLRIFPYLKDVKIDLGWGGPMECSSTLFPQIGTLPDHPNAFFVQGYSGFGVTPSHVVSRVLVDGMTSGSHEWDVMSSIPRARVIGKEHLRTAICTLGKVTHQLHGYFNGRR
ncbi:Gamma-glutamylputrescine oxidoreductase [Paraburkholderia sediminicola]|uniref:Gamma-glutamylputrescine oxidoreductase n=1 Tax=Paraburkholderia sediminicola TaxID=458836 RepID=A0A6J5CUF4_9BURK|nr:FAD-binding oxidoreductase [Paraburkholderia sediminicola]CAB3745501.1 Gamma-glutamylputrescine oxidoreductase [Paraburkholderia sediminicola]